MKSVNNGLKKNLLVTANKDPQPVLLYFFYLFLFLFFPLILTALNNSVLAFPGKRAHFIVFHISGRQSTALKHATGYANDWIA
jgi:hypothetical protein